MMKKRVFIIAEVGVNHNGDIQLAKKLIDEAVESGADAVKFQTFVANEMISKFASKAEYQKKSTNSHESQLDMVKKLELDRQSHLELINYSRKKGIMFLSTPFDFESIDLLNNIGLEILKIPSGEITNLPYLKKIGTLGKRIILSSGMSTIGEIETAIDILVSSGTARNEITVLQCTTEYPAPFEDVNLKAMITIREALGVDTGYSDHTAGIAISVAAAALGASVIEKHFTLDKNMDGPDHKASIEPYEFRELVRSVRSVEVALGDGIKRPAVSELKNKDIARKSIVASRIIKRDELFSADNITIKRPGNGLSPMLWDIVIGSKAVKDFEQDELIVL